MRTAVPVIDIEPLRRHGAAGAPDVVAAIGAACRDWGFFQVLGHGIPPALLAQVWAQTHAFFELPRDLKEAVRRSGDNARGYYDRELTKNRRDMKEVFDFGFRPDPALPDDHPVNATPDGRNQWPDARACPKFQPVMLEYFDACERVAFTLLDAISASLGLAPQALAAELGGRPTSFVRLNYYPRHDPLSEPGRATQAAATGHLGVHHHTDAGVLTLLLQDATGGLEVRQAGEWFPVAPVEGALVVNLGDVMQVWTNDRYQAPEHRVRASSGRARYSLPLFFNPAYETVYRPLAALTDADSPPRYAPISWGEFRYRRQQGDYADYGHEIQIADFRLDARRAG